MPLHELVSHGVVSEAELVEGDLVFRPVQGRNRNLTVERPSGPSYFAKLSPSPPAPDLLPVEADAYDRLTRAGLVPDWAVGVSPLSGERVLVLDLLPDADDLAGMHASGGHVSPGFARAAGLAIGALRRIPVPDVHETLPWTWSLSAPDERVLGDLSVGNLGLLAALQEDEALAGSLVSFEANWRPTCFMHGDVRLTNVVVSRPSEGPPRVALVDWEFAGRGDPAWDIGCLLAEYLGLWLMSLPLLADATEAELDLRARTTTRSLGPEITAAWEGFRAAAPEPPPLVECVRAAGVALVQSAFVLGQGDGAPRAHTMHHLQCAANVLADPERAAIEVFGLGRALKEGA